MSRNPYIVSMSSSSTNVSSSARITGRVKWFNNKAGYGFITSTSGAQSGNDIFVHHSALVVSNQQYRYLVQGEYVEFTLSNVESSTDHKVQSSNIRGVNGGKLLCETRNENRANNPRFRNRTQGVSGSTFRGRYNRSPRGPKPSDNSAKTTTSTDVEPSAAQENA